MNSLKSAVLLLVTLFCTNLSWANQVELDAVSSELEANRDDPILQMQYKMLLRKYGQDTNSSRRFRWGRNQSNLRLELSGGLGSAAASREFGRSMDLLTGQRAIEESLQLGSIGQNRDNQEQPQTVPVSDLKPVDIVSHPWEEMIGTREFTVPDISKRIPKDMLFVHMPKPVKFLELENILSDQNNVFGDVYRLGQSQGLKPKMMKRLGIPDADSLIHGVEEMAFVSVDLSFAPRTDYALIVKPKNALMEKGFDLIVAEDAIYKKVGDHLVIATTDQLLKQLESLDSSDSMASELDYHYALLEMEPNRDGLVYLSEAFIRKLTGPSYRINARRRNTVLNALESLQYAVFGYRRITGDWPTEITQMMDESYLAKDSVFELENYSIDQDGRVAHSVWGSIWQVTPVNQVSITAVTQSERENYERFSSGYQSFFREFFDPIAIAFTMSDQIYLHTLITPLIDNSDYRDLQQFISDQPKRLDTLFNPRRNGALLVAAGFSIDDLLLSTRRSRRVLQEAEGELDQAQRDALILQAEQEFARDILGEEPQPGERVLDFLGDEIFLGIGEKNSFTLSNIADIDVWFGVKLNNREKAEAFFRKIWQRFVRESSGFGAFGLSSTEPLSNEYNGQKYFMLPTGMINIFYIFYDDAFYVTISQLAMNRIIDGYGKGSEAGLGEAFERSFAHIGDTHNIAASVNLEQVSKFRMDQQMNVFGSTLSNQIRQHRLMLLEAMTLAKSLPNYDGTLENVAAYYRDLPVDFYGAEYVAQDGEVFLVGDGEGISLHETQGHQITRQLPNVLDQTYFDTTVRDEIAKFRGAGLGVSFIPEGLEVKLSIGNPNVAEPDERFSFDNTQSSDKTWNPVLFLVIGAVVLVVLLLFASGRKTQRAD
ncbi:MAG: hypothetical protein AAF438_13885 [Pseudomonadota bacterium]